MDSRINTQTNVVAQVMGRLDGFTLAAKLLKLGNIFDGAFAFDPKNQLSGLDSFNLPNIEITFHAFATSWPRNAFSVSFAVPEQNCDFQLFSLENASTAMPNARIDGDLEFRDPKIPGAVP